MEDRTTKALESFWLLSQEQKRRRILSWVQKPSKGVLAVLRRISSEDQEVQIRYLARKAMFHLEKESKSDAFGVRPDSDWQPVLQVLQSAEPDRVAKAIDWCTRNHRVEILTYLDQELHNQEDPFVLSAALIALGKLRGPAAVALILKYYNHSDARVKASSVEALGIIGGSETTPYLLGALSSKDNRIKANAIRALRSQDRAVVLESLGQMVHSSDEWMRSSAAYAIGEVRSVDVLELLAALLTDKLDAVRKMAFRSLERLSDHGIVEAGLLLKNLSGLKEQESIRDFLQLLEKQNQAAPLDPLFAEDPQLRLVEIHRIVREKDSTRFKDLEARLVLEEDNYIKASLILALGRVMQGSAVPLIKSFLNDPIPRIRANAIEALGAFSRLEYLPEILLRLDDSNNRARANAIIALRTMPYVDIYQPLGQMSSNSDFKVRQSAFYAICELNDPKARSYLYDLANGAPEGLLSNVRELIQMLEEQEPQEAKELKIRLRDFIDFDTETDEATEEEAGMEPVLEETPQLRESDFEGFVPDDVVLEAVQGVEIGSFVSAPAEKKAQMVEYMKNHPNQMHYTLLRFAERDKDFQVKCLARIALNQYKGKGFQDEDLSQLLASGGNMTGNLLLPNAGIEREKLEYMGSETTHSLNQDLARRQEQFTKSGSYGGELRGVPKILTALRRDTQELLASALGPDLKELQSVGLAYYSPTYKPFLEGLKSMDGMSVENFVQLNTMKTSLIQENHTDTISTWIKSAASPKYLLILLGKSNLVLFLRSTLQYSAAEVLKIPRTVIKKYQVRRGEHFISLALQLHSGEEVVLPRLQAKHVAELEEKLTPLPDKP